MLVCKVFGTTDILNNFLEFEPYKNHQDLMMDGIVIFHSVGPIDVLLGL